MNSRRIDKTLNGWRNPRRGIVIAVDGYSGAGKTTLVKALAAQHPWIDVVHLDDFCGSANKRGDVETYLKGQDPAVVDIPLLWNPKGGIKRFRAAIHKWKKAREKSRVLLVDGVFLFHPQFAELFDKRIYLNSNMRRADVRRLTREKARWGKKYFPEKHPDSFVGGFVLLHRLYRLKYRPRRNADLIVHQ